MVLISYFVGNKAKGRISKRVFQENKTYAKFSEKQTFLTACFRKAGGKKCSFFGEFGMLFLETSLLRFALLPYYRRFGLLWYFITKCKRYRYNMRQLFYHKIRQKFITKLVRFFITKCDSFITICIGFFKMRQLLQIATFITKFIGTRVLRNCL